MNDITIKQYFVFKVALPTYQISRPKSTCLTTFKKEGKVLICNFITFSSSSEEEYPDRSVSGRW
jgi:hypothetical protein